MRLLGKAAATAACIMVLITLLAPQGAAIKPTGVSTADKKRFGLTRFERTKRKGPRISAVKAFTTFNKTEGGRWNIRFDPRTGLPSALIHGKTRPRAGTAKGIGTAFLKESRSITQIDPTVLEFVKEVSLGGNTHLLYDQVYRGIPVENARVKIHLGPQGAIIGLNSTFEPDLSMSVTPGLTSAQAFASVRAELGNDTNGAVGSLVIFPNEISGRPHLAWKFQSRRHWHLWVYYVDAHTGQVLFRFDRLRRQTCVTSGTVSGAVFDIDPTVTPSRIRAFTNQRVYVADSSTFSLTDSNGFFCSGTKGKIFTSLSGPFVSVSNFRGPSAHYDNGSGVWNTVATPVSSPHPYTNNLVHLSTINISIVAPAAVKVLPIFSNFNVGTWTLFGGLGDITDNDQVTIIDSFDHPIATYVGDRGAFNAAAVDGHVIRIRLLSNGSGTNDGYDVLISSYLTLSAPNDWNVNGSSLTWASGHSNLGLAGEFGLFYHLNEMHDYFMSDINIASTSFIGRSFPAMAYVGPNFNSAFYDPEFDNLSFGDIVDSTPNTFAMDDATVSRHEYTHLVLEKIFSLQNYGQAGAISEGLADYFAASSLNHSAIGKYINTSLGFSGPLRELDCPSQTVCRVLTPSSWEGQIHNDSIYLSQSLWDIRKAVETTLIPGDSKKAHSCVDGLVFQAFSFFPESFHEFHDAILRVDSQGSVANCGGANAVQTIIATAFANHGIPTPAGDSFERNDGFQTAVDITTHGPVVATIFPAADTDFYSFAAGPGSIRIRLELPPIPPDSLLYKAYAIHLYDRNRKLLVQGIPRLDGTNTIDGVVCESFDCTTTDNLVEIIYSTTNANFYFVQIVGPESLNGSSSGVNSTIPYGLQFFYDPTGAFDAGVVTATFDNDIIDFTVHVTSFPKVQNLYFSYAQLRDQSGNIVPNTRTDTGGTFMTMIASSNALGKIKGSVQLITGFAQRFPSIGTVHLEVFGYTIWGSTISLGMSQPFNLATNIAELKTFNTIFNPREGGKATVKYSIQTPGFLTIKLYTLSGSLVKVLFEGQAPAGKGSIEWNGRNFSGGQVASGIYLLRMEGSGFFKTQKIAVVK